MAVLITDDVYNAPALQKGGPKDPLTTPSQYLVFELGEYHFDLVLANPDSVVVWVFCEKSAILPR